jgi:uncharacterized repeat protein (TIGR01451 family)
VRALRLEALETRNLLATLTVINTNDTGAGSLAQAITDANSQALVGGVPNKIAFDIPGTGLHKITLHTPLPTLTNPVIINGYTQPGASPNTNPIDQPDNAVLQIQLDGSQVSYAQGLVVGKGAAGSTIEGLVITGFNSQSGTAITLSDTDGGNHVVGNFIGLDPTGQVASTTNSNDTGVVVMGPNNVIGGTDPADRNVISGNHTYGVDVSGPSATNTLIEGNYLGLTADGNSGFPLGFMEEGVVVDHADGATIGGTVAAARNVIAGANAIDLNFATNTTVEGNFIGTDRTGTAPVSSLQAINVRASTNTQIGGKTAGAGNVIGYNAGALSEVAVVILGSKTITIQGNFIGTDPTGTHEIGPFSYGISEQGSTGITIGGIDPGEGNVIADDNFGGAGGSILFEGFPADDVVIEGNSLYGNDGAAIQDSATRAPNLTNATATTITGSLLGDPGAKYRVEYFATPDSAGASKFQGKTLIGFQDNLVADSGGNVQLTFSPAGGVPAGELITATATRDGSSTSGFSSAITVSKPTISADVGVAASATPKSVPAGGDVTFTITVTNAGPDAAVQAALATAVPAGTEFVSLAAPAGWAVNAPAVGGTGSVHATIASLAAGGQAVFKLIVHVDPGVAAGTTVALASTVATTTADTNSGNQSASASTTVAPKALTLTKTTLTSSPSTSELGQPVTFTAVVAATTGSVNPAGSVVFTIDGIARAPVPLVSTHGRMTAALTTSTLSVGHHAVSARYVPAGSFAASASTSLTEEVKDRPSTPPPPPPPPSHSADGPWVASVKRFGYHEMATTLVLTFNEALEPSAAQNAGAYRILNPQGRPIAVRSATYDPTNHTVTLDPAQRLNVHWTYTLIVSGTGAASVTSATDVALDGAENGHPGSDFVTKITRLNLVAPPSALRLLGQPHPRFVSQ